mmetsp:Transcript_24280/g.91655  ORF Transcript_24280/g.91655 Transcript_24280/m.91655 type:complete len:211 (-) Transcript_24280:345-977(-)
MSHAAGRRPAPPSRPRKACRPRQRAWVPASRLVLAKSVATNVGRSRDTSRGSKDTVSGCTTCFTCPFPGRKGAKPLVSPMRKRWPSSTDVTRRGGQPFSSVMPCIPSNVTASPGLRPCRSEGCTVTTPSASDVTAVTTRTTGSSPVGSRTTNDDPKSQNTTPSAPMASASTKAEPADRHAALSASWSARGKQQPTTTANLDTSVAPRPPV